MKDSGIAYLLWLFGLHRFYLNRPFSALLYWLSCGGFGVWALFDLLLIPGMVEQENHEYRKMHPERSQTIIVHVDGESGKRKRHAKDDEPFNFG